jgi:hypothetical protein
MPKIPGSNILVTEAGLFQVFKWGSIAVGVKICFCLRMFISSQAILDRWDDSVVITIVYSTFSVPLPVFIFQKRNVIINLTFW